MGGVQNIALGKHVNAYNGNYYNFTDGGILKISKKEREIYEKGLENDFEVDEGIWWAINEKIRREKT